MKFRQYKFKFYLNISHAIYINGTQGQSHPHTWEIAINALKLEDSFDQFNRLEEKIEGYLNRYQDQWINKVPPFDTLNPTLENCCEFLKTELRDLLRREGYQLLMIEMSETPTRSYIINLLDENDSSQVQSMSSFVDSKLEEIMNMSE